MDVGKNNKSTLEEYVSYGLYGTPEIKKEEKIRYLGSFRENVIKVISFEEIEDAAGIFILKLALQEPHVDKIIIHQNVREEKKRNIIGIAQKKNLEFSIVSSADFVGDVAVVLASHEAINRPDIYMDHLPEIPQEMKSDLGKALCGECMDRAKAIHPDLPQEYKSLSFFDRILGKKCALCEEK